MTAGMNKTMQGRNLW